MGYRYAIVGSGRQGTAAAYDLARFGEADAIVMADVDVAQAQQAARRVNQLARQEVARPAEVNVRDEAAVVRLLAGAGTNVFISGVPYFFNLALARAAIRAGA